eukprot:c8612_g1_i1.p1 GENE.c8612_g1_i1~~c8612_g1_i1.p1  ORF type:complete len:534 (+),score=71.11 c8612_g1_i1:56-1657(+)
MPPRLQLALPWPLILLYFLNSFMMSFPLNAMQIFLNTTLQFPPSVLSTFYATIFIPFCLKPILALISDTLPICGRHRRWYVVISSLGSAAMYAITGLLVDSIALMFVVSFARSLFDAFSELMLGATMVELADSNSEKASAMQSLAMSVRMGLAPLLAAAASSPLYPCHGTSHSTWSPRTVITFTSLCGLLAAGAACFLDDPKVPRATLKVVCGTFCQQLSQKWTRKAAFVLVQATAIWIGLKPLIPSNIWRPTIFSLLGVLVLGILFAFRHGIAAVRHEIRPNWPIIAPAIVLFVFNAVPDPSLQWSSFTFHLFSQYPCYTQAITIASAFSRLVASLVFFKFLKGLSVEKTLTASTIATVALSYLWVPLLNASHDHLRQSNLALESPVDDFLVSKHVGSLSLFQYTLVAAVTNAFIGQLMFLPVVIIATTYCPKKNSGMIYGIFLTLLDFGDSTSAWITAPTVDRLGITSSNWSGMVLFTLICGALRLTALGITLIFLFSLRRRPVASDQTAGPATHLLSEVQAANPLETTRE